MLSLPPNRNVFDVFVRIWITRIQVAPMVGHGSHVNMQICLDCLRKTGDEDYQEILAQNQANLINFRSGFDWKCYSPRNIASYQYLPPAGVPAIAQDLFVGYRPVHSVSLQVNS